MKRMRKNNTIILLVILLLSLSIGYALINTNLKINGTANVTKQTWDIHFENIQVTEGSVTTQNPATINPEYPTTVTYNIHLENPGDFYEFEVDAVNNGSIDAMITNITNTDNGQEISLPSYMEYKVAYSSGTDLDINHILEANTTETYKVGIYFKQDIQASELINSQPLDLRLKFEVTYGMATDEATPTGDITVTFDPNGGTLSKTTKKVAANGKYGNLPIPTRPGYKFKGWHGKNLFDPEEFYEIGKDYGVSIDENDIILSTFSYQQNYTQIPVNAKQNTQYTLSFDWEIITLIRGQYITTGLRIWYYGDSSKARISGVVGDTGYIEITSDSGKTVRGISSYGWEYTGSARLSNIQLEEGSTATPYEPYYITKDTTVVQTTNHTLTAIWEPITYNVTLDYNDGVTPSTTMQVTYGSTYGNLPNPTRTGYTFKGWNGKNQFDEGKYTQLEDFNFICGAYYCSTIQLKPNTTYALTIKRYNKFNGKNNGCLLIGILEPNGHFKTNGDWSSIAHITSPNYKMATYTTDETGKLYIGRYQVTQENLDVIWENTDVQLEEGSSVTDYEPYYITNSTPVTQATDHTLTAIWEAE